MSASPPSVSFEFPVLIADIGGTNARFGLVERPGGTHRDLGTSPTGTHADPIEAIREVALVGLETTPRTAILAIAAPIEGDRVRFTNSPWVLEPRGLITELGFR
ncbi:MAG: glucokinase, partial [Siculibacillus sp.]|nr:glucokinase [Siculibacillus sp.]